MILDLHVHSKHSLDSLSLPKSILRTARRRGLDGLAITDHNTISGAIEAIGHNEDPDFSIIVGAEISTEVGDIIGLFLNEEIKSRTALEVIDEIRSQGGYVVIPHPGRSPRMTRQVFERVDFIEGFNSRASVVNESLAKELSAVHSLPLVAGSDAHFCSEIGRGRVLVKSMNPCDWISGHEIAIFGLYSSRHYEFFSGMIQCVRSHSHRECLESVRSAFDAIVRD